MSEARAIKYAEDVLGVHDVYAKAQEAQDALKHAHAAVVEYAAQKRGLQEAISQRTAEFTSTERGRLHELSATAFEQHLKTALQLDPALIRLRGEYMAAQREHDTAEFAVKEAEFRARMYSARMEELGGLTTFYAAVKVTAATK